VLSVGGPGRLAITLEAGGGTAAPGTFTLPPLTLGRGDVARIATSSWKHLTGATVTITIRSASGRVRRTTVNNRFAGPHATHVTTAAAVIRGRRTRLTVATSPAGGRAASEVIAWTVLRGNHPVAHHQLTVTRPSHGAHRYVWDWQPSRPGRYRVIADLIVIAPDGSATSAAARPVSFRIAR
jgi:predicted ThiF/HesA family dinucleotide-utilizing enzyme